MKNKIKLTSVLVILFLISFVRADTDVSVGIITDQNINFNADLNAGGNVDLTIDGMNYQQTMNSLQNNIFSTNAQTVSTLSQDISDSTMDMDSVYYKMSEMFIKYNPTKNIWEIRNNDFYSVAEKRFKWALDTYFVPRTEVNKMMNYYEQRITDLELRVLALEKVAGDENVLKGRLNVANDLGVDLTYNNVTYHYTGHSFISLKTIEGPVKEPVEEPVEKKVPNQDLLIEKWKDLCDRGLGQFCLILEQRGFA